MIARSHKIVALPGVHDLPRAHRGSTPVMAKKNGGYIAIATEEPEIEIMYHTRVQVVVIADGEEIPSYHTHIGSVTNRGRMLHVYTPEKR